MRRGLAKVALVALLALTGCRGHESRYVTVLDRDVVRLAERPLPPSVRARSGSTGVLIRVEPPSRCAALLQDHTKVRERVVDEPGKGAAITGLALMGTGLLMVAVPPERGGGYPAVGLTLLLAGTVTAMAQPGSSEVTRAFVLVGPPYETLDTCSAPPDVPESVALWLPGGRLVPAEPSPTGLWRARVPDAIWQRYGRRILADVVVDGVGVRRVLLIAPDGGQP